MNKQDFENQHRVKLVRKTDSWWCRMIGVIWPDFVDRFWTTVRWPFCNPRIYYPPGIDPMADRYRFIRVHELIHANQQRSTVGLIWSFLLYFFVPLPILFSGRWFVERPAYLSDISLGARTIDNAVETLWRSYAWPWPKAMMRAWFIMNIN